MQDIAIAVIINLVSLSILCAGVFIALHKSIRVTTAKLIALPLSCVGSYFLTPVISKAIYNTNGVQELLDILGVSKGSVNSCLFTLQFLISYIIVVVICEIVYNITILKMKKHIM